MRFQEFMIDENRRGATVKLTDLYDEHELTDPREMLSSYVDADDLQRDFAVHTMTPEQARSYKAPRNDMTVFEAFQRFAGRDQKRLVRERAAHYDPDRIIVTMFQTVVDGNHHLVAGILAKQPIRYINLADQTVNEAALHEIPTELTRLAKEIRGRSYETAKRIIVAKVGSVNRGERFDDDVADAVFLRLQRNAQVGGNTSEKELMASGRGAVRMTGDGSITLYRAAPKGAGIRPGDFTADTAHEAGFYRHGRNVVQSITVPMHDVIQVKGAMGDGREYVYLPRGYRAPEAKVFYNSFRAFFDDVSREAKLNEARRSVC